jgi:hypothetical protein
MHTGHFCLNSLFQSSALVGSRLPSCPSASASAEMIVPTSFTVDLQERTPLQRLLFEAKGVFGDVLPRERFHRQILRLEQVRMHVSSPHAQWCWQSSKPDGPRGGALLARACIASKLRRSFPRPLTRTHRLLFFLVAEHNRVAKRHRAVYSFQVMSPAGLDKIDFKLLPTEK